jgi:hypothetical protein
MQVSSLKLPPSPHGARRVGRYLLCDQVGSGGMATIHLARLLGPQGFSRTVAVKQLHPQFAQNPQFVAMLLDEARLAVRVRHGNVISPLDIVATGSDLFIVMDYVNGESFATLLAAAQAPLRPALAAAILVQVLLGLHAAHEATREHGEALGLVHRDVSPQNILVGQDGVARVLDFGVAKAVARSQTTDSGMVKGKLGYMAPEQLKLEAVDRRADLFTAGVVLWEALTGTGLFVADALGASIELILRGKIAPPSQLNPAVTPELDAVVLKALERDREARFQDAMSMAAALQRATPLATALEVIQWVEELAGPELERKAELVRRAEALNWEPAVAPMPTLAEPRATGIRPNWFETVAVSSKPLRRTPTLLGLPKAPEAVAPCSALVATGESTGSAVVDDRDVPSTIEGKNRGREWTSIGVALGIVMAGATVALGMVSLSGGERKSSLVVARDPRPLAVPSTAPTEEAPGPAVRILRNEPAPAPPGAASSTPAARRPATEAPLEIPLATIARAAPNLRSSTVARTSTSPAARRSAAKPSLGSRGSLSTGGSRAESQPTPHARVTGDTSIPGQPNDGCKPPWTINEQQIKVFKAECLR